MALQTQDHALALPRLDPPPRLLAVVAPYYRDITDALLRGVQARADLTRASLEVVEVPGALEIPTAIALAGTRFDGYVALGCVIRGETTHYDTVCNDSSRALTLLGLQGRCIGNAILTVETMAQAQIRADPAGQDKGGDAMRAAFHLIALARRWRGAPEPVGTLLGQGGAA